MTSYLNDTQSIHNAGNLAAWIPFIEFSQRHTVQFYKARQHANV
jgi:hypothetical protein